MKAMSVVLFTMALCACASHYYGAGQKAGGDTALVCHKGKKTMELPVEAVDAHVAHGDSLGPCPHP